MNYWKLLTPTLVVESVRDLDPTVLKARGITAIITDLDNTLVPWRHYEIAPGVVEWLAKLEVAGIQICIASNTMHVERLKQLAATMNIPFVDRVRKPWTGGFIRSMRLMGSEPSTTAVFGDQIFTDVLAGNRLGLQTILVRPPLSREEFISTQMVRYIENYVIRQLEAQGQWPIARKVAEVIDALPHPESAEGRRLTVSLILVPTAAAVILGLVVRGLWRRFAAK